MGGWASIRMKKLGGTMSHQHPSSDEKARTSKDVMNGNSFRKMGDFDCKNDHVKSNQSSFSSRARGVLRKRRLSQASLHVQNLHNGGQNHYQEQQESRHYRSLFFLKMLMMGKSGETFSSHQMPSEYNQAPTHQYNNRKQTFSTSMSSIGAGGDPINSIHSTTGNSIFRTHRQSEDVVRVRRILEVSSSNSSTWELFDQKSKKKNSHDENLGTGGSEDFEQKSSSSTISRSGASLLNILIQEQHEARKLRREKEKLEPLHHRVEEKSAAPMFDEDLTESTFENPIAPSKTEDGEDTIVFAQSSTRMDSVTSPAFQRQGGSRQLFVTPTQEGTASADINDGDDEPPLFLRQKPTTAMKAGLSPHMKGSIEALTHPMNYAHNNHTLVNYERERRQLPPLYRNVYMDELARNHAQAMAAAGMLFHSVSSIEELQETLRPLPAIPKPVLHTDASPTSDTNSQDFSVNTFHVAENILKGSSVRAIHEETMSSAMHSNLASRNTSYSHDRKNILSKHFTEFGMGTAVVYSPSNSHHDRRRPIIYMVQLFRSTPPADNNINGNQGDVNEDSSFSSESKNEILNLNVVNEYSIENALNNSVSMDRSAAHGTCTVNSKSIDNIGFQLEQIVLESQP